MPLTPAEEARLQALLIREQQLTHQGADRPVVGTQQLFGMSVPIQQPATFEELRAASQRPGAQAQPPTSDDMEILGSAGGEIAGALTGGRLGALTSPVTGPVGPVVGALGGAAVGAAGGMAGVRKLMTGAFPGATEIAGEAALSAVPEVAETAGRAMLRAVARSTKGAQLIRFDEAARQARQLVHETFQPLPEDVVGQLFETVRRSGVRVGVDNSANFLTHLQPGRYQALLEDIAQIDRAQRTGGRFSSLISGIPGTGAGRVVALDIGQAQQLSSEIRKRISTMDPGEGRQLLRDFRAALDDDIFSGIARGRVPAGNTPETLQTARQEYARHRAATELSDLVEAKIKSSPDIAMASFDLRSFWDELRRGRTTLSQDVNRALDLTPGARQRLTDGIDNISQLYNTIEVSLADVSGFRRNWVVAGLGQMLSLALLTEGGQRLFRDAVLQGRGTLSVNGLAVAVNAARHELGLDAQAFTQPLTVGP